MLCFLLGPFLPEMDLNLVLCSREIFNTKLDQKGTKDWTDHTTYSAVRGYLTRFQCSTMNLMYFIYLFIYLFIYSCIALYVCGLFNCAFSVTWTILRRMKGWWVNGESERMWKEGRKRHFHGICLENTEKPQNFCRDSRSSCRDLKPVLSEYEAGVLTTIPQCSVLISYTISRWNKVIPAWIQNILGICK
jgi:hypothetical protein